MDTSSLIILIIILFLLLIFSSFFSAAETAYSSVSKAKIEQKIKSGKKTAFLIRKHYQTFGWTLATILIANNLVNIGASSLLTYLFAELMGTSTTVTIVSTCVATPLIVIFGEIVPKIFAKKYAYGYLSKVIYVMEFVRWLFFPLTFFLRKIALQSKVTNTETEIHSLLKIAHKERVLGTNEMTLAQKALELDSMLVRQAMTKKENIVSISIDATVDDARKVFLSSGHSRLIVKDNNKFKGVLILKDIAFKKPEEKIASFIMPLLEVSKSSLITKALEEMRINKSHIALVMEKKGSSIVVGIITIEDILEELVGEIYDEHDKSLLIREVAHYKYIAYGSATMHDLEKELEVFFDESDDMNVKQWVNSRINRKLKKNLRYEYKDYVVFKVIKNKNKQDMMFEITKKIN